MRALVAAASRYGATAEIAQEIGRELSERGVTVDVLPPGEVRSLSGYDAVVLGSAVYSGHWLEPATALVERLAGTWGDRPVWLFSSGPTGNPGRPLVQKMGCDPVDLPHVRDVTGAREHRMFAGKLDRSNLGFAQRAALVVVRGLEGDFRDWDDVRKWAAGIADALLPTPSPRDPR